MLLTYQHFMSNETGRRPALEDVTIVTMMMIELVRDMERQKFQELDNLQQEFIDNLTGLDIGLTGN